LEKDFCNITGVEVIVIFECIPINTVAGDIKSQYGKMTGIYGEVGSNNFTPPPLWTGDIGVTGQGVVD